MLNDKFNVGFELLSSKNSFKNINQPAIAVFPRNFVSPAVDMAIVIVQLDYNWSRSHFNLSAFVLDMSVTQALANHWSLAQLALCKMLMM